MTGIEAMAMAQNVKREGEPTNCKSDPMPDKITPAAEDSGNSSHMTRTRTPEETSLLEHLSMDNRPNDVHASFERPTVRRSLVLQMERSLLAHPSYSKLFHDNEERSLITDDPKLCIDLPLVHKFLVAKKFKLPMALKAMTNWIEWRKKEKPHLIELREVWEEYMTGKAYWHGVDKNGMPILVMRPDLHNPNKRVREQTRRFAIWIAEEGTRIMEASGQKRMVVLYDGTKISVKLSRDLPLFKEIVAIFHMYPEILGYAIVLPVFAFWALWKIGSPILDSTTKSKIKFMKPRSQIFNHIDINQLEKHFGGKDTFDFFEHIAQSSKPPSKGRNKRNESESIQQLASSDKADQENEVNSSEEEVSENEEMGNDKGELYIPEDFDEAEELFKSDDSDELEEPNGDAVEISKVTLERKD